MKCDINKYLGLKLYLHRKCAILLSQCLRTQAKLPTNSYKTTVSLLPCKQKYGPIHNEIKLGKNTSHLLSKNSVHFQIIAKQNTRRHLSTI